MIGELLVDFDGLGIAVGVVIDGSQRQLCQAGNLLVTAVGNLFQGLLGAGVVAHIVQGYAFEVAGHARDWVKVYLSAMWVKSALAALARSCEEPKLNMSGVAGVPAGRMGASYF